MRKIFAIVVAVLLATASAATAASQEDVQEFIKAIRANPNKIISFEKFKGDEKGRKGGFLATYLIDGKKYRMTYDRYAENCLVFVIDTDSDLDLVTLDGCNGIVTAGYASTTTDLHYSANTEKGKGHKDFWQAVFDKTLANSTAYFKR